MILAVNFAAFRKRCIAHHNVVRLKHDTAQLKSRLGFKWGADDCSWWNILYLSRVLHIRNVSAYSRRWNCHRCCHYATQNNGRWLCIYWSGLIFLSGQFKIYCPKITPFFCRGFSFHVWGVASYKVIWTGKRPHIHSYFFRCLVIIITFCCLPTLSRIIPVQRLKYKDKGQANCSLNNLFVFRENYIHKHHYC